MIWTHPTPGAGRLLIILYEATSVAQDYKSFRPTLRSSNRYHQRAA
jgi:hypothetical protein